MRRLTRLFFFLLILVLGTMSVQAAGSVTDMQVACEVDGNGNYRATVTAAFTFDEASGEIVLPLGENVRKISLSGGDYSKKTVDGAVCLVLKNSEGFVGTKTYVISYTKTKNVQRADDGTQVLDVQLLCALWDYPVDKLRFTVQMPAEFTAEPQFVSGYYGDAISVTSSQEGQTLSGETTAQLMDRESLDVKLTLPSGYFRLRHQKGGSATVTLALMAVLALLGAFYWFRTLRSPMLRKPARRLPPDGIGAWEFPYVAAGGPMEPSLLLAEWGALGYVQLEVARHGRVFLTACMEMGSERRSYEVRAFRSLFRRETTCHGDTPRCRKIGAQAARRAASYWNRRLFSRRSGNPNLLRGIGALILGLIYLRCADFALPTWSLRAVPMILAFAAGTAAGIFLQRAVLALVQHRTPALLSVVLSLLATVLLGRAAGDLSMALIGLGVQVLTALGVSRGGRRTASGMELAAEILAFRRKLAAMSTHELQLLLQENGQYFYETLPYAEALGLGRKFAKRFANIPLEPCAWLRGKGTENLTALEFYLYFHAVMQRLAGKSGEIRVRRSQDGEL